MTVRRFAPWVGLACLLAPGCDDSTYHQSSDECAGPVPDVWLAADVSRGFAPLQVTWRGVVAPARAWRLELGNGERVAGAGGVEFVATYVDPGRYRAVLTLAASDCHPETSDSVYIGMTERAGACIGFCGAPRVTCDAARRERRGLMAELWDWRGCHSAAG